MVSSFQTVLVLRTMVTHLMLPLGLAVLLVPSVLLAAFNHRWYQIMALEVLSRDGCGFCILPTWIWENSFDSVG